LLENEPVRFRLRCRKFIELIRREAETNMMGHDAQRANGHQTGMEIDDMDIEDGANGHSASGDFSNDALAFGQQLAAEYATDGSSEVRKALQDIFALMAYANPLREKEVAHLLDKKGRLAVAEELNSAILRKLTVSA
jgi:Ran-binding protein 9/10